MYANGTLATSAHAPMQPGAALLKKLWISGLPLSTDGSASG